MDAGIATEYSEIDLAEYAESLFSATGFDEAFDVFEEEVLKLGFEGVLYTYIPRIILDSKVSCEPVYKVSAKYRPKYLERCTHARYDEQSFLIKACKDGVTEPLYWSIQVRHKYPELDNNNSALITTSRGYYGISKGITLPLMSEEKGIAGASFITVEEQSSAALMSENICRLKLCTNMFHSLVLSSSCHSRHFIEPVLVDLNNTERSFLAGLARGRTPTQISTDLNKSEKYLEQVMLRIRRKLSGVAADSAPLVNRNQLLYYAGLLGLFGELD